MSLAQVNTKFLRKFKYTAVETFSLLRERYGGGGGEGGGEGGGGEII